MMRLAFLCVLGSIAVGCVVSKDSLGNSVADGDGDGDDDGGSTTEGGTGQLPDDGFSGGGAHETSGGVAETGDDPTGAPHAEQCIGLDHEVCYAEIVAGCTAKDTGQACIGYPFGPTPIFARDIFGLCRAELPQEQCYGESPPPECGPAYCDCVAGAYPFDWTNCFHLTAAACVWGEDSDCPTALAECYPGVALADYETCVSELDWECNCPMCGNHVECEEALSACLQ
jgi:hypothetical protein